MGDLDLTQEASKNYKEIVPVEKPYDPIKARDSARAWIAYILLSISALLIALAFIAYFSGKPFNEVKDLFSLFFTPILGLLGAVIGFYFGFEKGKR